MHRMTLMEISKGLSERKFSSEELIRSLIKRILQLDPKINSFITLTEESALRQAIFADSMRYAGKELPLLGLPIAHKDSFCTSGVRTTCGSKMLDNFKPPYNATVVSRLFRAGAISLGKTNMDEFGMGSSNETSYYGPVRNPWNTEYIPGGSSGGSAAAVASGFVPCATGTDTGGSVRQPASLTNLTGLKPTYGRVSRWGMTAYASSLDQAGLLTKTAEDCALLLQEIAGFDSRDSTSSKTSVPNFARTLNTSLKGLRIGIPEEVFSKSLHPAISKIIYNCIKELEKLGVIVKSIKLPSLKYSVGVYLIIAQAEASSNLSRFDGVRFGYRCKNPLNIRDLYERSRAEGFGQEVKRRILLGTSVLSNEYYDNYYLKSKKIRKLIKDDFISTFSKVDLIITPTTPFLARKINVNSSTLSTDYLDDIYTVGSNLVGLPAISVPAGFVKGLPVGVQFIAPYFQESLLLRISHQYQMITDWHKHKPAEF